MYQTTILTSLLFLFQSVGLLAQEYLIEQLAESGDISALEDVDSISLFVGKKLRLNKASHHELSMRCGLSLEHVQAITQHIDQYGPIHDWEELQLISILSAKDYIAIQRQCILDMPRNEARDDRADFRLRWKRHFLDPEAHKSGSFGNADYLSLRIRGYYNRIVEYGITIEKDAGERLFDPAAGFQKVEYFSGYVQFDFRTRWVHRLIIGDCAIQAGYGLLSAGRFILTKSTNPGLILREGRFISSHRSSNESNFFRGLALELSLFQKVNTVILMASNMRDAALTLSGIDGFDSIAVFRALKTDGLHRTTSERDKRNQLREQTLAVQFSLSESRFKAALNLMYNQFSHSMSVDPSRPDIPYRKPTRQFTAESITWRYKLNQGYLFGELAVANLNSLSFLSGIVLSLGKKSALSVLFRSYSKSFYTLRSNSFGHTSSASNEQGVFLSFSTPISSQIRIESYIDLWYHPWLEYRKSSPSAGIEYRTQLLWERRKQFSVSFHLRSRRVYLFDSQDNSPNYSFVSFRFHIRHHLSRGIEYRCRFEWNNTVDAAHKSQGILLYIEYIHKKIGSPWTFKIRPVLFRVEDYQSRIYAYEFDLIGSFSIPSYSGEGFKIISYVRRSMGSGVSVEFRMSYSQLNRREATTVPVVLEQTDRLSLSAQFNYRLSAFNK